jgi:transcriptional regulator with XRE-family HTH domain
MYDVTSSSMAAGIKEPLGRVLVSLGSQLKALRMERGWTLERLSKVSKLSEPYLSRLESGIRQPSLAALITLSQVYDIPLRTLLEGDGQAMRPCKIIRSGSTTTGIAKGMKYRAVSGGGAMTALQAIQLVVPANRPDGGFYKHEGEEWLYVISGGLSLMFEDEVHTLEPGDAAHFDARTPHRLAAAGKNDAVVLLVASRPRRRIP